MDDKNLRTESAIETRSNDGNAKYGQGVAIPQCNQTKAYQDNVSNSLGKVDTLVARPCAVICPDRVVPPTNTNDAYLMKVQVNPWTSDNVYRRPSDYPQKMSDYQLPTRNISPRQTFQENMQRVMVPPTYSSVKTNDTSNYQVDRNVSLPKNIKINVSPDMKYCEVPYAINQMTNEHKSARNPDVSASTLNPVLSRIPHGWPPGKPNAPPSRPYGAPEHYPYQEYPSCAGPRPMPMVRPLRTHEDSQVYSESYYQDGNIRFKPYQTKERYVQSRYEYYPNSYHTPPPYPAHKYDLQKSAPLHSYPTYTQVPLKYLDRMASDPVMDGYQRPNQTPSYNISFRNQVVHPTYGPIPGNCLQNKLYSYSPDGSAKVNMLSNNFPYDNKAYIDYEHARSKGNPLAESYYANENMMRTHPMKNQMVMPGYSAMNVHSMQPHPYYRKENPALKPHEFYPPYRNMDPSINHLARFPAQFSPNTSAISPADSNTSIDTIHTQGTVQEDCGYVSQSSTASVRSIDSGITRFPHDVYRRNDYRYQPIMRSSPTSQRCVLSNSSNDKDKKNIDVRQFLQMWNESEDETDKNNPKKDTVQAVSGEPKPSQFEIVSNPEQLYVLGLVNVSSEELSKYEHIQKISKLPENIKGYNSIELLNQFEEAIESSNAKDFNTQPSRNFQIPFKSNVSKQLPNAIPRPVSPLDVEAKISQSVIHKEVGCNFEIKPCSPKMLNVEVAAPVQTILNERVIEKVTNQLSPICENTTSMQHVNEEISSCKMVNGQYLNSNDSEKNNYSLHDLESNPGVCFASLPRLDNDIELSFPEINQQFITANKAETSPMKDLPVLDVEQSENKNCVSPTSEEKTHKNCLDDTESEFAKLSKYRKTKKKNSQPRTEPIAIRTDSVIIKNPENTKCITDVSENHLVERLDITALDTQLDRSRPEPLNSPNKFFESHTNDTTLHIAPPILENELKSDDVAIDFSLNKMESEYSNEVTLSENMPKINDAPDASVKEIDIVKDTDKIISFECNLTHIDHDSMTENMDIPLNQDISDVNQTNANYKDTNCSDLVSTNELKEVSRESITSQEYLNNVGDTGAPELLTCSNETDQIDNKINDYCFQKETNQLLNDLEKTPDTNTINSKVKLQKKCNENPQVSIQSHSTDQHIGSDNEKNNINLIRLSNNHNSRIHLAKGMFSPWIQKLILNSEGYSAKLPRPSSLVEKIQMTDSSLEAPNTYQLKSDDQTKENCLPNEEQVCYSAESEKDKISNENSLPLNKIETPQLNCIDCYENKIDLHDHAFPLKHNEVLLKSDENLNTVFPQNSKLKNENDKMTINKNNSDNINNQNYPDKGTLLIKKNGLCTEGSTLNIHNNKLDIISENKNSLNVSNTVALIHCDSKETSVAHSDNVLVIEKTYSTDTCNKITYHDAVIIAKEIYTKDDVHCKSNEISSANTEDISYSCESPSNIDKDMETSQQHSTDLISDESLSGECLYGPTSPLENKNDLASIEKDNIYCPDLQLDQHKTVRSLKRSLSDSALFSLKSSLVSKSPVECPFKRKKLYEADGFTEQTLLQGTQNNRRNSVASSYIEDNVSFCILIDNDCIIQENNETDRICLTEIDDSCFSKIHNTEIIERRTDVLLCDEQNNDDYSDPFIYEAPDEKSFDESWVEDVACVETVVSDDIAEDVVIHTPSSPNDANLHLCDYESEESDFFDNSHQSSNHMDKIKHIYGNKLCNDDAELVETLYRTPQMNVNKTLTVKESHYSQYCEDLETVLSESKCHKSILDHDQKDYIENNVETSNVCAKEVDTYEQINNEPLESSDNDTKLDAISNANNNVQNELNGNDESNDETQFDVVCRDTDDDNVFVKNENCLNYNEPRSPEVSSTTPEEKNSSILLKITSYKGSRISQLKNYHSSKKDLHVSKPLENEAENPTPRPFITKAAQKYIPPLTIHDLKVKLPLPQQSLNKLKQLKVFSSETKHKVKTNLNSRQIVPKKPKPKFEDILKSIDEIQIKRHKEKSKKSRKSVPMVVIKKNENGSHYASSLNKDNFNPDLTGRKWQPWVFIEKNAFIDKMALRNKTRAVYNHRKNTYVLEEKFQKYKAVTSQFVISHPDVRDSCTGLKYTIKLKHSYSNVE